MLKHSKSNQLLSYYMDPIFSAGFTIIELLVVIVVIGILAAITIISYSGITNRAISISLQSDLSNASNQLEMYKIEHDFYPSSFNSNNCPVDYDDVVDEDYCLKPSSNNNFTYIAGSQTPPLSFRLEAANTNGLAYYITNSQGVMALEDSVTFAVAWDGSARDLARVLVQTSDGGFVVAGTTGSYGAGSDDAFITKYDASGNLSWSQTWGGSGMDSVTSMAQTSDGGYVIAGSTFSYGAGSDDVFIAKYDTSGNLSWSRTWGGSGSDSVGGVIQISDDGYIVVGTTGSYGAGGIDGFIAKYDTSGNLSWSRTWGGSGSDLFYSVVQNSDGSYVVAGVTNSYGAGSNDALIAKYDTSGNLSWSRTLGGSSSENARNITRTDDGYAIVGATSSYGAGSNDALIAKYDTSGNLSWSRTWGGGSDEYGLSIIRTNDDGYAITGSTYSYGIGNGDAFIAKYDNLGNLSWNQVWGGYNYDTAWNLIQTEDSGYAIVGEVRSFSTSPAALLMRYSSDGSMANCGDDICTTPTVATTSPTATTTSPTATTTSPTATTTSPTATTTSPDADLVIIVAP